MLFSPWSDAMSSAPRRARQRLTWYVRTGLGCVFILAALLVFGTIAWASSSVSRFLLRSARAQRIMHRITAVLFLALALRLALSSQ